MIESSLNIIFDPALPTAWLWGIIACLLVLTAYMLIVRVKGLIFRVLTFLLFLLLILNPTLLEEIREAHKDTVLLVLDESQSMSLGTRMQDARAAVTSLSTKLQSIPSLDVQILPLGRNTKAENGTQLFSSLSSEISQIPKNRLAGVIIISDGQIHDVPDSIETDAPIHFIQVGGSQEQDRRIDLIDTPVFGVLDSQQTVQFKVTDSNNGRRQSDKLVPVKIFVNHVLQEERIAPLGVTLNVTVPIENPGPNVIELITPLMKGELSPHNNHRTLSINGVRDRLRVLLVTGAPHNGGRMWRQILKSDPSVDLIHFTILRPPDTLDNTPINELSLIAFPVEKLFNEKIYDFDLIIFDDYKNRGVLTSSYFDNIAKYIDEGGAFLEVVGNDFLDRRELTDSNLYAQFPITPTGQRIQLEYKPKLTAKGRAHPITRSLSPQQQGWSPFFRLDASIQKRGDALMTGIDGLPLLVSDRVGKGRMATIMTDQLWLWYRGYESGGPSLELLRRLAHWLMKEPTLDEFQIDYDIDGMDVTLRQPGLGLAEGQLEITTTTESLETLTSTTVEDGLYIYQWEAPRTGVFYATDGRTTKSIEVGAINKKELKNIQATDALIQPVVQDTQGGSYEASGLEKIKIVHTNRSSRFADRFTLSLHDPESYRVVGADRTSLIPYSLLLFLGLGFLMLTWWRES